MAERKEDPFNRVVMKPPRYLQSINLNPMPWGYPYKNRRAELNAYEQGREIGATEREPDLEERLIKRRTRQAQNAQRRWQADQDAQDAQQPPA